MDLIKPFLSAQKPENDVSAAALVSFLEAFEQAPLGIIALSSIHTEDLAHPLLYPVRIWCNKFGFGYLRVTILVKEFPFNPLYKTFGSQYRWQILSAQNP